MAEVVTVGECMATLYPHEPVGLDSAKTMLLDIGGAESNLAMALCRLGHSARFVGRVGDDSFGLRIRTVLAGEGVDTACMRTDPDAPTGLYIREWLPDGMRRVYYYRKHSAGSRLEPADLVPETFAGARVVHLTGITPALSQSAAAAVEWAITLAQHAGALVSFDPNYRARLWDTATARATLLPLMQRADLLLIGDEDARAIFGAGDDDMMLEQGAACGAQVVVLKCGERGALALADGQRYHVPAVPVAKVIDPVGAGDGFDAGFLAGWLRGERMEAMVQLGALVGAGAVAALGDYHGYPRQRR